MKKIRLFISSPGDVNPERGKVPSVVSQINRIQGDQLDFHIDVIDWKTHVAPDMGRPQEMINKQIGKYDIFVGIMWKRFGTPTGHAESGTEEEFRLAYDNWQRFKCPRIMFYFCLRPYMPKNIEEVNQMSKVISFREELQHKGLVGEYQSPEDFGEALLDHLASIMKEWFLPGGEKVPTMADFKKYIRCLMEKVKYIDIRGLVTGEGKAHRFRIDHLYIPLMTSSVRLREERFSNDGKKGLSGEESVREMPLQEALREKRLIIKGDPGAGKTTFLRLIAFTLCRKWLGEEDVLGRARLLWPDPPPLPILVPVGRLAEYFRRCNLEDPHHPPIKEDSPGCLPLFLEKQSREYNWGLAAEDFRKELEGGRCLILLDGPDEAPDPATRQKASTLASHLFEAFQDCQVVLTSRPAALIGPAMPANFDMVEIAPLDDQAIDTFLTQWSSALYPKEPGKALEHKRELSSALQCRPEIRRMARNPVMLTALAVVHWNEHRLPEQRAELYESIITWLVRAREQRPGRLKSDRCRKLLQKLALAMFTHKEGRQRQVGPRWAAETLAAEFVATNKKTPLEQAESFLREEMVDSGIIVERGHRLEFWHLSFQEYLAAFEIGGLLEKDQIQLLFKEGRIYSSEWREPVLLLGGVLYKQGDHKINHLIDEIIKGGPKKKGKENLPQLAQEVGLLGSIVHDLAPFSFSPSNPEYNRIVQSVMGIFEKEKYRDIPVQVRIEAADTLGRAGDPRLQDNPMVTIKGGRFWMGAQKGDTNRRNYDPDADESDCNESPVHQVELSPFSISKYPVTVGKYQKFMEDSGYDDECYWRAGGFGEFKGPIKWEDQKQFPSRPVVNVSWYEAAAYASWARGRLPTEVEWERAARGPQQEYRKYPWGNKEPTGETANFRESQTGNVTPVGIFPEDCSPEGVMDMAGNVWEWCNDWFSEDYYRMCAEKGIVNNPDGPKTGKYRVVRGGSFSDDRGDVRCASRDGGVPRDGGVDVGFRVVRAI